MCAILPPAKAPQAGPDAVDGRTTVQAGGREVGGAAEDTRQGAGPATVARTAGVLLPGSSGDGIRYEQKIPGQGAVDELSPGAGSARPPDHRFVDLDRGPAA